MAVMAVCCICCPLLDASVSGVVLYGGLPVPVGVLVPKAPVVGAPKVDGVEPKPPKVVLPLVPNSPGDEVDGAGAPKGVVLDGAPKVGVGVGVDPKVEAPNEGAVAPNPNPVEDGAGAPKVGAGVAPKGVVLDGAPKVGVGAPNPNPVEDGAGAPKVGVGANRY